MDLGIKCLNSLLATKLPAGKLDLLFAGNEVWMIR